MNLFMLMGIIIHIIMLISGVFKLKVIFSGDGIFDSAESLAPRETVVMAKAIAYTISIAKCIFDVIIAYELSYSFLWGFAGIQILKVIRNLLDDFNILPFKHGEDNEKIQHITGSIFNITYAIITVILLINYR